MPLCLFCPYSIVWILVFCVLCFVYFVFFSVLFRCRDWIFPVKCFSGNIVYSFHIRMVLSVHHLALLLPNLWLWGWPQRFVEFCERDTHTRVGKPCQQPSLWLMPETMATPLPRLKYIANQFHQIKNVIYISSLFKYYIIMYVVNLILKNKSLRLSAPKIYVFGRLFTSKNIYYKMTFFKFLFV